MRNSFNLLLVALAFFDNVYLFGGILQAVHRREARVSSKVILYARPKRDIYTGLTLTETWRGRVGLHFIFYKKLVS